MQKASSTAARLRVAPAFAVLVGLAAAHGVISTPASGQIVAEPPVDSAAENKVVVSGFLGTATSGMLVSGLSAGLFDERRGWVLRGTYAEEFVIFGPSPDLSVWDLGVQRAAVTRSGVIQATIAGGPALTGGMNRGRYLTTGSGWFGSDVYEEEPFLTVGLVGNVDITAALLPFLGLGVEISGNANLERPYAVGALHLSVGGLR